MIWWGESFIFVGESQDGLEWTLYCNFSSIELPAVFHGRSSAVSHLADQYNAAMIRCSHIARKSRIPDAAQFNAVACLTCRTCTLQATVSGFRLVTRENVFKVCDQPHPLLVAQIVDAAAKAQLFKAYEGMKVGDINIRLSFLTYSPMYVTHICAAVFQTTLAECITVVIQHRLETISFVSNAWAAASIIVLIFAYLLCRNANDALCAQQGLQLL